MTLIDVQEWPMLEKTIEDDPSEICQEPDYCDGPFASTDGMKRTIRRCKACSRRVIRIAGLIRKLGEMQ